MKKIVNEIIENNPELAADKDKLEKVVNLLADNNPQIVASKEFKKSLKSRIDGIIKLKQGNKSNFLIFAIPIFSLLFIASGFMYYYKDIQFFSDGNKSYNPELIREESIKNIEIQQSRNDLKIKSNETIQSIENVEDTNISNTTSEQINKKTVPKVNQKVDTIENNNTEKINNTQKIEDTNQKILQANIDNIFDENTQVIENTDNTNNEIEDDSIIEIFESLGLNVDEEYQTIEAEEGINATTMSDSASTMRKSSTEPDFDTFCTNQGATLSGTGTELKCIMNNKQCLASDFINGACEFTEIK
ncbi:MAG: hypothetical protein PHS49_07085 [Candidatus Gracilibacteria bacterium]|nr:hypothetical protein [Candidatus Gracilibacteria bacterium]